ncbi:hypothetical protein C460_16004 [Haloferax sp. ATCC BAA-646]|nr:hypothetical protein C460_16004 [Haloferax sp. ATCC BAA-646]
MLASTPASRAASQTATAIASVYSGAYAGGSSGRTSRLIQTPPSGADHSRFFLPRLAVCLRATTTTSLAPSAASSRARSFEESSVSWNSTS